MLRGDDDQRPHETRTGPHTLQEPTIELWDRLLPTLAILITSGCATAVWSLRLAYWRDSLGFYNVVVNHRVRVQVFIHVLSSLLTVLWTYAVCTTINLLTRLRFARGEVSINTLRLLTLVSQARLDPHLPFLSFLICAAFYTVALLPAWLWTSALTPQLQNYDVLGNATLPRVGVDAYPFLNVRSYGMNFDFECWNTTQANGTFTSCPGLYQSGNLLQSTSSAITIDGSPRNHSKYDNTEYRYMGRSYGVSASVGLTINPPSTTTLQGYNYTEQGYLAREDCIHNSSSL